MYLRTLTLAEEKHSQRTTRDNDWKNNDPTCSSAHFSRARVAFWANSHKERIKHTLPAESKLLCQKQGICIFVAAIFALLTFLWQEIFLCWKFIPFPHYTVCKRMVKCSNFTWSQQLFTHTKVVLCLLNCTILLTKAISPKYIRCERGLHKQFIHTVPLYTVLN